MGKLSKDAKDLLIGNDGSEKEPNDFKTELQDAIKTGTVTKSDGTLLITARMNVDKLGEKIDKNQEKGVKKIKDNSYDTPEELEAEDKEKKDKEKKKEEEKKRRQREAQLARNLESIKNNDTSKSKKEVVQEKELSDEKR